MNRALLPHRAFGSDPKATYRDWLVKTVKARECGTVAEVGVQAGRTTYRLASETTARIWAVDTWRGVPGDPLQAGIYRKIKESEKVFHRRLRPWIKSGRVRVLKMDSMMGAVELFEAEGRTLDLAFLDADHSYDAVRGDIWAWRQVVRPGGILCGHDLNWPGVKKAVDEALAGKWKPCAGGFAWWWEVDK